MRKAPLVSLVVTGITVVLAFVLNPSPERHRAAIRAAVSEPSPLAGLLGLGALTAFASNYHPLGVASYTTVNGKTVSIGVLGMVFVVQSE